jgi:hypothetical protein
MRAEPLPEVGGVIVRGGVVNDVVPPFQVKARTLVGVVTYTD